MMVLLIELASSGLFDSHELLVIEQKIYDEMGSDKRSSLVVRAIKKLRKSQQDYLKHTNEQQS